MRPRTITTCLLMLIGTVSLAVAQGPFVGTWKLNTAKSHLTGAVITFGPAENDAVQLTANGANYSFRVDGKAYRMASGELAVWQQDNSTTWKTVYRDPQGKLLSTDTWTLSPDRRSLTVVRSGMRPDGRAYSGKTVYARAVAAQMGGSPAASSPPAGSLTSSLMGSWKSTAVTESAPEEMIIATYGLGGLSFKFPAQKISFLAVYGGKEVAPTGPQVPPALTIALERVGASGFRLIRRFSGAVTYSAVYTISSDGKTIKQTGNANGDPSQTLIWEKQ